MSERVFNKQGTLWYTSGLLDCLLHNDHRTAQTLVCADVFVPKSELNRINTSIMSVQYVPGTDVLSDITNSKHKRGVILDR